MAEMRASPVVYPRLLSIAKVLQDIQGPMGQIIPGTDVNPFKLLPAAQSVENWAYGNSPFSDYPSVTSRRLPVVKTGREGEVRDLADVALMGASLPAAAKGVTRGANFLGDVLTQAVTRNPNATSMMALDEIARMTRAPQIAPNPAMVTQPAKSDLGFYSQLEAATLPLQNKGSGEQYLAQISKTPGVKPEELQWTGLDEFLRSKPSVTKAEIQDYLNANRVDVQEVRLGGATRPYPYRTADEWQGAINRAEDAGDWDEAANINQAWEAFEGYGPAGMTKFSQYTLPGGENYREILLTLPEPPEAKMFRDLELRVNAGERLKPEELQKYHDLVDAQAFKGQFHGTHFDQPNILAHMRANDRVVDGKNTLFIEEIQSDWHQAGRKKGYATGEKAELPEGTKVFEPGAADSPGQTNQAFTVQIPRAVNGRSLFYGTTREEALANAQSFIAQPSLGAVPDAPFKTSWHELALKRAIQEASEKGYDQIAFTTGKTQAERYDLSKQVDELLYKKNPDGTYRLSAQVRGRGQSFGDSIPESKLEEYVGKEVAKSITQGSGKDVNLGGSGSFTQPRDDWKSMSGLDLQVGGEGMKGFYDNILPKSLDKLGKKFGAKVTKSNMDGTEVWTMPITPEMRKSVTTKGQPLFAIPAIGTGAIAAEAYRQNQQDNFGY